MGKVEGFMFWKCLNSLVGQQVTCALFLGHVRAERPREDKQVQNMALKTFQKTQHVMKTTMGRLTGVQSAMPGDRRLAGSSWLQWLGLGGGREVGSRGVVVDLGGVR